MQTLIFVLFPINKHYIEQNMMLLKITGYIFSLVISFTQKSVNQYRDIDFIENVNQQRLIPNC